MPKDLRQMTQNAAHVVSEVFRFDKVRLAFWLERVLDGDRRAPILRLAVIAPAPNPN